jgi:uncharacterized phage protein (TIGR01671 family)
MKKLKEKTMKPPKFRFWNKLAHRFQPPSKYAIQGDGQCIGYDYEMMAWDDPFDIEKSFIVAQQYTGLKDKNGKEIYEGDIVRFDEPTKLCRDVYISSLYVFGFHNGSFLNPVIYNSVNGRKFSKVEPNSLNPDGRAKLDSNPHFDWTRAEVLGNIYENPELVDL